MERELILFLFLKKTRSSWLRNYPGHTKKVGDIKTLQSLKYIFSYVMRLPRTRKYWHSDTAFRNVKEFLREFGWILCYSHINYSLQYNYRVVIICWSAGNMLGTLLLLIPFTTDPNAIINVIPLYLLSMRVMRVYFLCGQVILTFLESNLHYFHHASEPF